MDLPSVFTTAAIGLVPASLTSFVAYRASVRSTRATQQASHRAVQATHAKLHHEIAVELLKATHEHNRARDPLKARDAYMHHEIVVRTLPDGELRTTAEVALEAAYAFASREDASEYSDENLFLRALGEFEWMVEDVREEYRQKYREALKQLRIFYRQQDAEQEPSHAPVVNAFTTAKIRHADLDCLLGTPPEERRRALAELKAMEQRGEATLRALEEARSELERATAKLTAPSPLPVPATASQFTMRRRRRAAS